MLKGAIANQRSIFERPVLRITTVLEKMNRDTSPILINQGLSNAGFESTMSLDNDANMAKNNFNRFEFKRFCDDVKQIFSSEKILKIFKKSALYFLLLIIFFCCFATLKKVLICLNIPFSFTSFAL